MTEPAFAFHCENQDEVANAVINISNDAKRVLVVEDDNDLREMLGDMLEHSGHAVVLAANREEALRILEREMPDLILLDVMLPDGSGLDICRRTAGRENNYNPATVFVLSGRTSLECKLQSFLSGAKRFFAKPFEMDDLIDAIEHTVLPKYNPANLKILL